MPQPPQGFLASLQLLDPLLSIRWGDIAQQWVIQRKSVVGQVEMQFLGRERDRLRRKVADGTATEEQKTRYIGIAEEHECARVGCRVILFVSEFTPKIFDILALGDIQRYDGYSRYCDTQDAEIEKQEKLKDRAAQNVRFDLNMETFGRNGVYDFIVNKRQAKLQHGERDVKRLLGIKGAAPWETAGLPHKQTAPLVDAYGRPLTQ